MPFLGEQNSEDVPTIPEYYKGKTIFLTGGSGFMGKALIEKLLYSCSELDRIYLLIRNKRGVKPEDRLAAIYSSNVGATYSRCLSSYRVECFTNENDGEEFDITRDCKLIKCFNRLREEMPNVFMSKVSIIAGDVSLPGLGISQEDRALIIERTNIIFHAAASVRFDDSLKVAAQMNLRAALEMLELAKEIPNLECYVHLSTSYSNTNRNPIEEILYPPLANWRDTLKICETVHDRILEPLTAKYLGEIPNTYGFTKQLGENLVYEYKGILPIVLIRPSIVISSIYEPMPGWVDNFNGPVGVLVARGKGILRTQYVNSEIELDYMPVDIAIKSIIIASWIRGTKKFEPTDNMPIYNCCSGGLLSLSYANLADIAEQIIPTMPLDNVTWLFTKRMTSSLFVYNIQVFVYHLLPALFFDMLLWMFGKKPMLVKLQRRVYIMSISLTYYANQLWTFTNTNFLELRKKIKEFDKAAFYYDIENIDKEDYFLQSYKGGKKYLLKESDDNIEKNRAHYNRLIWINQIVKCIFYGFLFWWLMNTSYVKNVYEKIKI